jgi:hypothetical protein
MRKDIDVKGVEMGAREKDVRRVAVIGPEAAANRAFAQAVAGEAGESAPPPLDIDGVKVELSVAAGDRPREPSWLAAGERHDLIVLVLRHLDRVSLETAAAYFEAARAAAPSAVGIVILREPGADAFKISCPACGHRMWVSFGEIGRRGRCTRCDRPISVAGPVEHVRHVLSLPDGAPVLHGISGDGAVCRGALSNLLSRAGAATGDRRRAALGETTVVDLPRPAAASPRTGRGIKVKSPGPRRTLRIVRT